MQRISQGAVGVTRGASMLFSAFEDEGPMWADEGPRVVRQRITFAEPFLAPPGRDDHRRLGQHRHGGL